MSNHLDFFTHKTIRNNSPKAIFLLHGTGGNEEDLFPLVDAYKKSHTIVGLRGNILEYGLPRFFARKSEGVFDMNSIEKESKKFIQFIKEWSKTNFVELEDMLFVGYSNGANMILATMFKHPEIIRKAVVLHPMLPYMPDANLDLSHNSILLSWSPYDTVVTSEISAGVISVLTKHQAQLTVLETKAGHSISQEEVEALEQFTKSYE